MRRDLQVVLVVSLGLIASAACNRKAEPATEIAGADTSLVVALERGACFGRCPEYRVELFESGKVLFTGKRNLAFDSTVAGTARVSDVRGLTRMISDSGFASLDSAFVFGSTGCGAYIADLPTIILWAKVGSVLRRVEYDPGCQGAPRVLGTIAARIDTVAGTSAWIERKNEVAK